MRPRIEDDETVKDDVREYAREQGMTTPAAWLELVKDSLERKQNDDT